jgi:cell fate regulator YaaT (PSP1 superfamily)
MADNYDSTLDEDDISALEDKGDEKKLDADVIVGTGIINLEPDTPVYRLRLSYSNETFLAAYRGDAFKSGDKVLVPTRYGKDLAEVIGPARCLTSEIAAIERPASEDDLFKAKRNKEEEAETFRICQQKIEAHGLEMKLVSVHYLLEEPKILFFFTADNRVDFRDLVKDLVSVFRMRIELRQIGVRDESRVVGGLGVCGRGYCCNTVSDKLKPVSIKMAKDQNLSLNSMKISGPCGRLLCCLAYEHSFYNEQRKLIPQEGTRLNHDGASWKVTEVNIATSKISLSA